MSEFADLAESLRKPVKGAYALSRRDKRLTIKADEEAKKREAKARDGHKCRWPRADHDTPNHVCLGPLEAAHQVAKGMGGDKDGSRTTRAALLSVCRWIHQMGTASLEQHGRKWEGETADGADGPIAFYRRDEDGEWYCVGRETSQFLLAKD